MLKKAETVYKLLNGIMCVYKPPNASCAFVIHKIKNLICKDLNNLKTRPPHPYLEMERVGTDVTINVRPSFADNVLCVGPRYQEKDLAVAAPSALPFVASGVYVVCVKEGVKILEALKSLNFTRCYHVKGVFGEVHVDYNVNEKVLARATYDHVERYHMERVLASFQASTQKRIIEEQGLDLQSEEAYEFAVRGLYRPTKKGATIVYSLKVVEFEPPDFTIEVQCVNESAVYLQNLIHNLGLNLKTFAACTGIRCIRQGCFHVEHSLLLQQCNVENILKNMKQCWKLLEECQRGKIRHESTVKAEELDLRRKTIIVNRCNECVIKDASISFALNKAAKHDWREFDKWQRLTIDVSQLVYNEFMKLIAPKEELNN